MEALMQELTGAKVVVDTDTSFIYLGELERFGTDCCVLTDVDVHDRSDVDISKEKYILDSRRLGIRDNRKKVYILRERIVSISNLDDVIQF